MLTNAIVSSTEGGLQQLVASLFLLAKAIGLMPMADQGEADDKTISVCVQAYNGINDLPLSPSETRCFFDCHFCSHIF